MKSLRKLMWDKHVKKKELFEGQQGEQLKDSYYKIPLLNSIIGTFTAIKDTIKGK